MPGKWTDLNPKALLNFVRTVGGVPYIDEDRDLFKAEGQRPLRRQQRPEVRRAAVGRWPGLWGAPR